MRVPAFSILKLPLRLPLGIGSDLVAPWRMKDQAPLPTRNKGPEGLSDPERPKKAERGAAKRFDATSVSPVTSTVSKGSRSAILPGYMILL